MGMTGRIYQTDFVYKARVVSSICIHSLKNQPTEHIPFFIPKIVQKNRKIYFHQKRENLVKFYIKQTNSEIQGNKRNSQKQKQKAVQLKTKEKFLKKQTKNKKKTKTKMFAKSSEKFVLIVSVLTIVLFDCCYSSTFITPPITHPGKQSRLLFSPNIFLFLPNLCEWSLTYLFMSIEHVMMCHIMSMIRTEENLHLKRNFEKNDKKKKKKNHKMCEC